MHQTDQLFEFAYTLSAFNWIWTKPYLRSLIDLMIRNTKK